MVKNADGPQNLKMETTKKNIDFGACVSALTEKFAQRSGKVIEKEDVYLNDSFRVNRILNILWRKRQFPLFGEDTSSWRYSINQNTKQTYNDLYFSMQQYHGMRKVIEEYRYSEMRPKFKRFSQYNEWLFADIWRSLNNMHMEWLKHDNGWTDGWTCGPITHEDQPWKYQKDMQPSRDLEAEWNAQVEEETHEEWESCWIDNSRATKEKIAIIEGIENMKAYLKFARKCALEEEKLNLMSQRHQHYCFLATCQSMMPAILVTSPPPITIELPPLHPTITPDDIIEKVEELKPENLVKKQKKLKGRNLRRDRENYPLGCLKDQLWDDGREFSENSDIEEEPHWKAYGEGPFVDIISDFISSDQKVHCEMWNKETCVIDSSQSFIDSFEIVDHYIDDEIKDQHFGDQPMEVDMVCQAGTFKDFCSYAAVDGKVDTVHFNLLEKNKTFYFREPIPVEFIPFIAECIEEFLWQENLLTVEQQQMLIDDYLIKNLNSMQQCLSGTKKRRYISAAKIFLQNMKAKDLLKTPLSSIKSEIDRDTLERLIDHFSHPHSSPKRISTFCDLLHQFILYNISFRLLGQPDEFAVLMQAQGDNTGEVLEAIENIDKTNNVTFLHERPVNTVITHTSGEDTTRENTDISESPYSIKQLLERNYFVASYTWTATVKKWDMSTYFFPLSLVETGSLDFAMLRLLAFFHGDVHITAMFNGNKFCEGILALGVIPLTFADDLAVISPMNYLNFPCAFLNAAVSNVLEFRLPFNHFLSYLPQQSGKVKDQNECNLGQLFIMCLNPLQAPEGVSQSLDVEIFARFVNPTVHQTISPFNVFGYVNKNMKADDPAFMDGDDITMVTQGDDQPIVNRTVEEIAHRSGDANVLALTSSTSQPLSQMAVPSDYSLEALLRIPSLLETFSWKPTANTGDYLWSWDIAPNYFLGSRVSSKTGKVGTYFVPTMLNYVTRAFLYYEGDVILKFQFVKNDFVSGRMGIYSDPTWVTDEGYKYDKKEAGNVNKIVVDIQQQNEIEVRIPFTSIKPLLRCDRWRTTGSPKGFLGEWHQGILGCNVETRLITSPNFQVDMDVNVYVYAAENFRVCIPVPFNNLDYDRGYNFDVTPMYPIYSSTNAALQPLEFPNKDYVYELYFRGTNLFRFGLISSAAKWYEAQANGVQSNENALKWRLEVNLLREAYKDGSRVWALMDTFPGYDSTPEYSAMLKLILDAVKALKPNSPSDMLETQAFERYVTMNKDHPAAILLTKNNRPNKSIVMDQNCKSLSEILSKFYPLIISRPYFGLSDYLCITVPVSPSVAFNGMGPMGGDSARLIKNHLCWFSNVYNFWEGSLKYKLIVNRTGAEMIAVYQPNVPSTFDITQGHDSGEVQEAMMYGSNIAATHIQGGLEVEIPFSSSYHQLMLPKVTKSPDLRFQNGTLKFYIRCMNTESCMQQIVATVLIAAGKDFKMNWITPPLTMYEGAAVYDIDEQGKKTSYNSGEIALPLDNGIDVLEGPLNPRIRPFNYTYWRNIINPPAPPHDEPIMETQGLSDVVNNVYETVNSVKNASSSIPITLDKVSEDINKVSNHLISESSVISSNISEVKESINKNFNLVTSDFKELASKVSGVSEDVSYYINLTASTMLTGNVIRAFIVAVKEPGSPGRWIDLGLSFAALLGFSIRHVIVQCVQNVLDWFQPNEQSRAQALSGAILNEVEENEETILKSVAVLGTILYAYIFECLPDFTNIKSLIKELLTGDPEMKTQGLGLNFRAAHFGYMGLTALSKVFDNIIIYTRRFIDWILERDSPEALLARKASEIQDRVMTLIKSLDKYDNEYEILYALQDPEAHNKFYAMMDEAKELTEIFMKERLDARIGTLLTECRTRTTALIKKLESEAPACGWRFDPYIVFIHGPSGTGKSNIMAELMKEVSEEWKLSKYNRIYAKTVKDEFWSGYTGQPIVQWDEFGQNPKNDGEAMEIVELRSNLPKRLNMAALHEKGRYFNSKCIFVTTNVPYAKFGTAVRDDNAYRRRRNLMLEMDFQEGWNVNRVQDLPKFDPAYTHCRFRFTDPMNESQKGHWISLDDVKVELRGAVHSWGIKQESLYEDYMRQHGLGVLPRGVVSVPEPVKFNTSMSSSALKSAISSAASTIVSRRNSFEFQNPVLQHNLPTETIPLGSSPFEKLKDAVRSEELTPVIEEVREELMTKVAPSKDNFFEVQAPPNSLEDRWEFKNACVAQALGEPLVCGYPEVESLPNDSLDSNATHESVRFPPTETVNSAPFTSNMSFMQDLMDVATSHNYENSYHSCPETKKDFMYVLGHAYDSEEWKKMTEEEKKIAQDFVNRTCTTVAVYGEEPKVIQRSWAQRVKDGISFLYHRACNIFSSIKEKVTKFISDHPKITIGLAVLGSLGALAGTMWIINKEVEKPGYEDGVPVWQVCKTPDNIILDDDNNCVIINEPEGRQWGNDARVCDDIPRNGLPVIRTENAKYDANTRRPMMRRVVAQGCEDPNAIDIRERVHPNLMVIGWPVGASRKAIMRALHVKGSLILAPFHFFAGAKEGESFVCLHRQNAVTIEFCQKSLSRLEGKDWCIYNCGARLEPRKDVCKNFISEKHLHKIPVCDIMICNVETNGTHLYASGKARAVSNFKYKDDSLGEIYTQVGWETSCSTKAGDCGSFLLALNKDVPGGKIVGIHTAGEKGASHGFGVLVTREMLEKACEKFLLVVQGLPIPPEVNTSADAFLRVVPAGDYSIYGAMPNQMAPSQPQKSDFQQTGFLEEDLKEVPNLKKPAHLHAFTNVEGQRISPLHLALRKYGKETKSFKQRDIQKVKAHVLNIFKNQLPKSGFGIFSEEQAVLGIPGNEFAKPLNLVSAPGWPYQVLQKDKAGKRHLFDESGKVIDAELRKRLDERLALAKRGERVPSLWRDCLKDELRPNAKVDAGKSRLFTIAPVDFNLLVRRYFMDFNISFYSKNNNFFSAVGMDPESFDWTKMYHRLAECGTKTIAGDYGTFDGTLMPDLMDLVGDIINEWYDDGEENAQIRKTLINEMIHTMQLVENCVYATHQGNPSGNPLTVIINTIINYIYLCLAFLEIYPEMTLEDFAKYCRCVCYGDDMLATVMEIIKNFNQHNLTKVFADHGIEFTSESKDGREVAEFRELETVTFLKRGFRKDPEFGNQFWLPTMSEETLTSFFHWVRQSVDPEAQLRANMDACLRFACFLGREKYEWYLNKWSVCMRHLDYSPIMITYEEQIDRFHYVVGMLAKDERFQPLIDKLIAEGDSVVLQQIVSAQEDEEQQPSAFKGFLKIGFEILKFYGTYWLTCKILDHFINIGENAIKRTERARETKTDDRFAFCIPSGEGKTTLANKYPHYLIDHDEYVLKNGRYSCKSEAGDFIRKRLFEKYGKEPEELGFFDRMKAGNDIAAMYESWVRDQDSKDLTDRRMLLTHHPYNTKRHVLQNFILPEPTGIRCNLQGREALKECGYIICTYQEREDIILDHLKREEAHLFKEHPLQP